MKKVNKNSPAPRSLFGGQTAPSPAHYERSAQIICIGKNKCTIGFKTLKNGGVGHLKTQKKKPNFGGDTHVTVNPKP